MNDFGDNDTIKIWPSTPLQRLVIVGVEVTLIFICLYLVVAFTFYLRFRQRRKNKQPHQHGVRKCFFAFFYILLLFGILKMSIVLFSFFASGERSTAHCDAIERCYQITTGIALTFLYLLLWLRQYSLYRSPSLKSLVSPWLFRISKYFVIVIFVIVIGAFAAVVLTADEDHHKFLNSSGKCVFITNIDPNVTSIFVCYAILATWQAMILFLFVYILHKHQSNLTTHNVIAKCSCAKLQKLVRNCIIASVISLLADVTTVVLDTMLPGSIPQPVFLFLWDICYVINLGCVLFCFANWRFMMFPWVQKKRKHPSFFADENRDRSQIKCKKITI